MRKNILFIAVGLFLFLSCKKGSAPDSGVLESFAKLENPAEQRLAFNLLTVDERALLVSDHIDFCLSFFDLNSDQKNVLNEAKVNLSSFFKDTLPEENPDILLLEKQIVKHFSEMDLKTKELIFSTMVLSEEDVNDWNGLPVIPPYSMNCTCSTASDYCDRSDSGVKCLKGGCNSSAWGCGTLWFYACGGLCFTSLIS